MAALDATGAQPTRERRDVAASTDSLPVGAFLGQRVLHVGLPPAAHQHSPAKEYREQRYAVDADGLLSLRASITMTDA